jgi:hypothetical protein
MISIFKRFKQRTPGMPFRHHDYRIRTVAGASRSGRFIVESSKLNQAPLPSICQFISSVSVADAFEKAIKALRALPENASLMEEASFAIRWN